MTCTDALSLARARPCPQHYAKTCIPGLGPKLVERLVDAGLLNSAADLYFLKLKDVEAPELLGAKNGAKVLAAVDDSRRLPARKIVWALGIT